MQSKGFIKLIAVLLALACVYQLSFTFKTRGVEKQAAAYAAQFPLDQQGEAEQHYLDSVQNLPVYNLGFRKFTYKECKEKELNLGLDLKGGMNVMLEVQVEDVVKALAGDSQNDPAFIEAIGVANEAMKQGSSTDYISDFVKAYSRLSNGRPIAELFVSPDRKDITLESSDADVEKILKKETEAAIGASFNVLRSRIDHFGVTQPNILRLPNSHRILVELPGVKEPQRVRDLLQGTASLEFWTTYDANEIFPALSAADKLIKAELAQAPAAAPETAAAEAAAASKAPAAEKKEAADANAPLDFEKIAASIPAIEVVDMGVSYKQRDPESPKFVTIGERIHCISPVIREAMNTMNPEPILKRAAEQIKAGATYLDVNIGPAESNGPELMTWAVKLLQENFNNVPLALDTANKRAIEAGIKVYNRTNGKPIVNSADAGSRISYIDLAAANDAICIALCSADGIAKDNEERMMHCHHMLERGLSLGMEATDLWFDPLFLVVKGMQDKQMDVLNAIKLFSDEGLKSTGGLSNNSNGAPKNVRPIMDSALVAMAMMQGLTSAIVNPNDLRLMETIKSCDIFKNNELYSDSYLDA